MKRFFSRLLPTVLGLALLTSITAFAQTSEEARTAYEQLLAKSQSMSDMNMYMRMDMMASDGTDTINMAMDMNILAKNSNQPDQFQFLGKTTMSLAGVQVDTTSWYKDGYIYSEAAGQKVKMKMDMTEAMNSTMASANMMNLDPALYSEMSLRTEGETRILSYTMDSAKVNEYIKQLLTQMGFDELFSGMEYNVRAVKGDYTLAPDNSYTHSNMYMYMDMSMDGETIAAAVNTQIELINPGQPIEIQFPDPAGYADLYAQPAA